MITAKAYWATTGGVFIDRALGFVLGIVVVLFFAMIAVAFSAPILAGLSQLSLETVLFSPTRAGAGGGIGPVILSTVYVISLACLFSLPISFLVSVLLSEYLGDVPSLSRALDRVLELLAAIPSIVFGLVGNAFFCVALGFGYSILSGALTLAIMITPFVTKSFLDTFRSLPNDYRISGEVLGLSRMRIVWSILLPAAVPSFLVGLMLGLVRALSETAALLFTSGYSLRTPGSVLDSGRVLSVHIYDLAMNVVGGEEMANLSALVLILAITIIGFVVSALQQWWNKLK